MSSVVEQANETILSSRPIVMPVWFLATMVMLNAGASVGFFRQGNGPWSLIYLGACLIQIGSLWAIRRGP